jgi:tripartite-type tricarboxylate transporter receptor subunit TctC
MPKIEVKMALSKHITRRAMLAAGVAGLLLVPTVANAAWPDRPIRLIVPFEPGASNDILARSIALKLSERLGQPIVVENKGGAGGIIGTEYVAKSPPDGNTLLFVSISITTNAAIKKKLPYDVEKNLQPIGEVGAGPFVVVVSNALNVKTLQEFIDLARAKPNSINYGSAGVGGINHLGTELFAAAAKVQLVHVPYKGMGPAFNDLIAGNLQMGLPSLSSVVQHIHAGTMRGLAVTGKHRSPLAPELPTADEAGLPGFELEVWWGMVGPANMPAAVVKRLNDELNAVLEVPEMQETLLREGATPHAGTPEDFGNLIRADLKRWKEVVANADLQIE